MIGASEDSRGLVSSSLGGGELLGVWIAFVDVRARTGRVVFGVEDRLHVVRFTGVPFAPAGGLDVRTHFGIQGEHARQRAPRAAQPDVRHAGLRGQLAMVEYEQAL